MRGGGVSRGREAIDFILRRRGLSPPPPVTSRGRARARSASDPSAVNEFISESPLDNFPKEGRCVVCVGEDNIIHSDIGEYQEVFNIYSKVELQ